MTNDQLWYLTAKSVSDSIEKNKTTRQRIFEDYTKHKAKAKRITNGRKILPSLERKSYTMNHLFRVEIETIFFYMEQHKGYELIKPNEKEHFAGLLIKYKDFFEKYDDVRIDFQNLSTHFLRIKND